VQELVKANFIPVADQVDRLQSGSDADCLLFQKFANIGHSREPGGTRQGVYVATPAGKLLASVNSSDPREVEEVIRKGLKRWEELPPGQRTLAENLDPKKAEQWQRRERMYPQDGLVLRVVCRDLPRQGAGEVPKQWRDAWNIDYAWFRKEEARSFVPVEFQPGATRAVPRELVERLARLHLVDSVRAQTEPFDKLDVARAEITAAVVEVADAGRRVSLRLDGATRTSHEVANKEENRGYDAKLMGRAVYDTKLERFTSFELLAVGSRWGATTCNMRVSDRGPAPMAVILTVAGDSPAERLPPGFLGWYGWQ
jgi:hypothetical protein